MIRAGCFETSKLTTHTNPIYTVENIIHYCVANIPEAVVKTSILALTNETLPQTVEIVNKNWEKAMIDNNTIKLEANVVLGKATYQSVADAFRFDFVNIEIRCYRCNSYN